MNSPISVLVVDDSKVMCQALRRIADRSDTVRVVAEANNGVEALDQIVKTQPDVVTLDVDMPVMDGVTTLKHIMIEHPRPVLMLSSLTADGADLSFDALRYGAVDFIQKPASLDNGQLERDTEYTLKRIETVARVAVGAMRYIRPAPASGLRLTGLPTLKQVVVIGAADGGYAALLKLIPALPAVLPAAYVVVLYAPFSHVAAFADYLDRYSEVRVRTVADGIVLEPGVCYLSAGDQYLTASCMDDGQLTLQASKAPFSYHRGSLDMLLFSLAEMTNGRALAVVLSGVGADGAEGSEEILRHGGDVIAQDPASCLFAEMPTQVLRRNPTAVVCKDYELAHSLHTYLAR